MELAHTSQGKSCRGSHCRVSKLKALNEHLHGGLDDRGTLLRRGAFQNRAKGSESSLLLAPFSANDVAGDERNHVVQDVISEHTCHVHEQHTGVVLNREILFLGIFRLAQQQLQHHRHESPHRLRDNIVTSHHCIRILHLQLDNILLLCANRGPELHRLLAHLLVIIRHCRHTQRKHGFHIRRKVLVKVLCHLVHALKSLHTHTTISALSCVAHGLHYGISLCLHGKILGAEFQ
mmetsp:Transcript_4666/g.8798  ORF Transcript_4666/g.8798 Transcript_4666/m.8798 type:complete len:234 (+) Transcript_4666:1833-2534(+)